MSTAASPPEPPPPPRRYIPGTPVPRNQCPSCHFISSAVPIGLGLGSYWYFLLHWEAQARKILLLKSEFRMVLRRVYWLLGVLVWLGMGFIGYFGSRLDR